MAANMMKCPLSECSVCGGALTARSHHEAMIYGFGNPEAINIQSARCVRKGCRLTYTYNLVEMGGVFYNCFHPNDFLHGLFFVNRYVGFTIPYIKFFLDLKFRAFTTTHAFSWCATRSFG